MNILKLVLWAMVGSLVGFTVAWFVNSYQINNLG
jgi:hypothetical protein